MEPQKREEEPQEEDIGTGISAGEWTEGKQAVKVEMSEDQRR